MNAQLKTPYDDARPAGQSTAWRAKRSLSAKQGYRVSWKRLLDIVLVIATAPISVPLVVLGGFLAMLDGETPIFLQPRVGQNGRVFQMVKLRTMRRNAEQLLNDILMHDFRAAAEWQNTQKLRHDPRITRAGRFLRKSSLDELPQLWNVLRGDMSLVGPRPMLQEQAILYPGTAYFRLRPGLTGPWQVFARNEESFTSRAKYDAMYEREIGLTYDLSLIARTFWVVLWGTGH